MNFEFLLKEIETAFGFENISTDENNEFTLSSQNICATIKEDDDYFLILTRLYSLPENPLALYKLALSYNNFAKLDAYIGIDTRNYSLTMTTKFPSDNLVGEVFLDKLERHFVNAESFLEEIAKLEESIKLGTNFADNKESIIESIENNEIPAFAIRI